MDNIPQEVIIALRTEAAIYAKRQGTHDNPDITAHDFFEGAQFGYVHATAQTAELQKEVERLKYLIEAAYDYALANKFTRNPNKVWKQFKKDNNL